MQTYNPIRGMAVCVSGGEYVRRSEAERKISNFQQRIQELDKVVTSIMIEMDNDEARIARLCSKIHNLENDVADKDAKISELENRLTDRAIEIARLQDIIKKSDKMRKALDTIIADVPISNGVYLTECMHCCEHADIAAEAIG